jgi:hypothetical protein
MATSIWENFGRNPWCSQTQHATHITRKKTHSTWHGLHIKKRAHTQNLQAHIVYTPPYTHTLKLAHNSNLLNTHTTCAHILLCTHRFNLIQNFWCEKGGWTRGLVWDLCVDAGFLSVSRLCAKLPLIVSFADHYSTSAKHGSCLPPFFLLYV